MKPLVGISCCTKLFGTYGMPNHAASDTYVRAVDQVMDAVPVLVPANGEAADVETLVSRLDGIILTGSRSNVRPALYGGCPHPRDVPEDVMRDAVTLPLIRECIARGVPVFGICRGFQEFNVAFGGTLHPEIREIPGRMNHRMPPDGTLEQKFEHRHVVSLACGGQFHRLLGADRVMVNSLHGQGILDRGERIVIEGYAPDATPEAIVVEAALRATASRVSRFYRSGHTS